MRMTKRTRTTGLRQMRTVEESARKMGCEGLCLLRSAMKVAE
jgi:hypothetical protein